jgi:hypothetical protein
VTVASELLKTKPEWPVETKYATQNKFKDFSESYGREYASLFANLDKVLGILRQGSKMGSFQIGFFRSESGGVFRIGQTGVKSAKESRLYVFPNQDNEIMYLLTIGTKDRQTQDINEAQAIVKTIRGTLEGEKSAKQTGV